MAPTRDPAGRGGALVRRLPVWGEGFAEDEWSSLAAVSTWDAVDPDEYLRLFPRLVPRDGVVPEAVRIEIERRLRDPQGQDALSPALREAVERRLGHPATCLIGASTAAAFAFWARIHPAYLWPSCAVMHQRATTIGWLGVLAGGRAAWMPGEVAEDLLHALSSTAALQDGEFGSYLSCAAARGDLLAAARLRSDGRPALVGRRRSLMVRIRQSLTMRRAGPTGFLPLEVAQS